MIKVVKKHRFFRDLLGTLGDDWILLVLLWWKKTEKQLGQNLYCTSLCAKLNTNPAQELH